MSGSDGSDGFDGFDNEKYHVFKADEFEAWVLWLDGKEGGDPRYLPPERVRDAVVIRRQDVFAPPALDAYANGIQVAIEVLVAEGWVDGDGVGEGDTIHRLRNLADFFHGQAALAWDADRKIPD